MQDFQQNPQWKELLFLILPFLEDLPKEMTWALGGGTALSLQLAHRTCANLDIFFEDTRALKEISQTNLHETIIKMRSSGNVLEIRTKKGNIFCIFAMKMTNDPHIVFDFNNKKMHIETIDEIIAKKIKYKSSELNLIDVVDISSAIQNDDEIIFRLANYDYLKGDLWKAYHRLSLLKDNFYESNTMYDICIHYIEDALKT